MAEKMKPGYVCWACGKMFDEPDYIEECMGECWGAPVFETFPVSPCCGSDFSEATEEECNGSDK